MDKKSLHRTAGAGLSGAVGPKIAILHLERLWKDGNVSCGHPEMPKMDQNVSVVSVIFTSIYLLHLLPCFLLQPGADPCSLSGSIWLGTCGGKIRCSSRGTRPAWLTRIPVPSGSQVLISSCLVVVNGCHVDHPLVEPLITP